MYCTVTLVMWDLVLLLLVVLQFLKSRKRQENDTNIIQNKEK